MEQQPVSDAAGGPPDGGSAGFGTSRSWTARDLRPYAASPVLASPVLASPVLASPISAPPISAPPISAPPLPAPPIAARQPARRSRAGKLLSAIVISVIALGGLSMAAVALMPTVGLKLLVVTSGSMAPYAQAGDGLIVAPTAPDRIAAGDVITFRSFRGDRLVTHRVISTHTVQDQPHFRTQGDANASPDPDLASGEGVVGTGELVVPYLGRWLLFQRGRTGQLLLLVVPSVLLLLGEARSLFAGRRPSTPAAGSIARPAVAVVAVTVALVTAIIASPVAGTVASFLDTDAATTNGLVTATEF